MIGSGVVFPIGRSPHDLQSVAVSHSTIQVGLQGDAIHLGVCLWPGS
jgi:hypothetical protein